MPFGTLGVDGGAGGGTRNAAAAFGMAMAINAQAAIDIRCGILASIELTPHGSIGLSIFSRSSPFDLSKVIKKASIILNAALEGRGSDPKTSQGLVTKGRTHAS